MPGAGTGVPEVVIPDVPLVPELPDVDVDVDVELLVLVDVEELVLVLVDELTLPDVELVLDT